MQSEGLDSQPSASTSYFDRAREAAVKGDREALLQALRTAASLDPAYQPFLQAATDLKEGVSLTDLFVEDGALMAGLANRRRAAAAPRANAFSPIVIGLACAGGLLLAAGAFLLLPMGGKKRRRGH